MVLTRLYVLIVVLKMKILVILVDAAETEKILNTSCSKSAGLPPARKGANF